MRAWENRPDTMVIDEPFYAYYLAQTGLDHPGRDEIVATYPAEPDAAIARCLAPVPAGIEVVYQKHMTHHLLPGLDRRWLEQLRHVMLIRDPIQVLASYTRVRETVTLSEIGLVQQQELAERTEMIIDADDFLGQPRAYLEALCQSLDLPFDDHMLHWPAGRRDSDGCWAPYWYSSVEASTGFGPPRSTAPDVGDPGFESESERINRLPAPLRALAGQAMEIYRSLGEARLVLPPP
jgi:hypothetical protein